MLRIQKSGSAVCGLTARESDGVFVAFDDDSYVGFLSWKSLRQMIQMKSAMLDSEARRDRELGADREDEIG